jgi:predicted RND superfamily exporter protein
VDYIHYPRFIENVRAIFREALGPDVGLDMTGSASLYARTFSVVNASMARSYVIAFFVITPLMMLMIGERRAGLLAMIPNVLPVFLTLGLMGWLRIPVDSSTLLVGCIIVGLAVDDTIHFMHRFQRSRATGGEVPEAVRETLASTGPALVYTSLVISLGFIVMTLAYMNNTRAFGTLAAFATLVALLADVLLAPALLMASSRWRGATARIR